VQPYHWTAHPARAGERRSPAALGAANHHHPVDDRLPDHSSAHDDIAHDDIAHDNSADDIADHEHTSADHEHTSSDHEHTSSDDTTDHEHTAVDDPAADDTTDHEHASADFVPDPDGDRSTGLLTSGFSAGR